MAMSKKKSNNDIIDFDVEMAFELHQRYNPLGLTENAVLPEHLKNNGNYEPKTLIDETLEIIDPTPNIYTLFSQFNERFFSNKLLSVEVKWSQRMTSCAGVCSFQSRSRYCIISLSAPLLKLRPRKDLVETLLHEMIHGYLFLTNNNRDRDGHGPEFCKIMDRINKEAGTHITIYHSFHNEVKLYQQHWWRCNGPCHKRPPYFGTVRRAMNRAPGPSDSWWKRHQLNCNGTFIKIREPEKKKITRSSKGASGMSENKNVKGTISSGKAEKNLDNWLNGINGKSGFSSITNTPTISPIRSTVPTTPKSNDFQRKTVNPPTAGLVKLGTSTNNVHGWGTAGPGNSSKSSTIPNPKSINDKPAKTLNFAGTLGGAGTGRSNLLEKYSSPTEANRGTKHRAFPTIRDSPPVKKSKIVGTTNSPEPTTSLQSHSKRREFHDCPICNSSIIAENLNDHLDFCLINENKRNGKKKTSSIIEINDSPEKGSVDRDVGRSSGDASSASKGQRNLGSFVASPKDQRKNNISCPKCQKIIDMRILYDHLDECAPNWLNNDTSPPVITGQKNVNEKPKKFVNSTDERTNHSEDYVCLVCSMKISGDIALTDHLEMCVKVIFNDDSFDVGNDSLSIVSSPKNDRDNVFGQIVGTSNSPRPTTSRERREFYDCPICNLPIIAKSLNDHVDLCLTNKNKDNDNERGSFVIETNDSPKKRPDNSSTPSKGQTYLGAFVASPINPRENNVSCPKCQKIIDMRILYDHLDKCSPNWLNNDTSPPVITRQKSVKEMPIKFVNLTDDGTNRNESYVCLVCSMKISGEIALADHLEECVEVIFKNDSFDVGDDSNSAVSSPNNDRTYVVANDKFPCPICMDLVEENLMNEHLDKCLLTKE